MNPNLKKVYVPTEKALKEGFNVEDFHELNAVIFSEKEYNQFIKKTIDSTDKLLKLVDNHIEYLTTSEGDEHPSITIENLEGILNRYFSKK